MFIHLIFMKYPLKGQLFIMYINHCGTNFSHPSTFCIDRPAGSGDYLFIYTKTPFILISNGNIHRYPAKTVVFFHKGLEQRFMASGNSYANDYIHFDVTETESEFIRSLNIPHATPFFNLDVDYLMTLHQYLCVEQMSDSPYAKDTIHHLLKVFLIKLSEAIHESTLDIGNATCMKMKQLRTEIHNNPEYNWNIPLLAARVSLSESHFQLTYKQLFGKSPINDIILARIEKAKSLLATTNYSIGDIAQLCGYENESHFSRQFRKYSNLTPSQYRYDKQPYLD